MSDPLSKKEDVLSGPIELLDKNDYFQFFPFCFFHSMVTSSKMSIWDFLVFSRMRYVLSYNDCDEGDGVSWKSNEEPCGFFSSST